MGIKIQKILTKFDSCAEQTYSNNRIGELCGEQDWDHTKFLEQNRNLHVDIDKDLSNSESFPSHLSQAREIAKTHEVMVLKVAMGRKNFLATARNKSLDDDVSTLKSKYDDLMSEMEKVKEDCKNRTQSLLVQCDALKDSNCTLRASLAAERDKVLDLHSTNECLATKIDASCAHLVTAQRERDALANEKVDLEDQRNSIQGEYDALIRRETENGTQMKVLKEEKTKLEEERDILAVQTDELNKTVKILIKNNTDLEDKCTIMQCDNATSGSHLEGLNARVNFLEEEKAVLEGDLSAAQKDRIATRDENVVLEQKLAAEASVVRSLYKKQSDLEKQLVESNAIIVLNESHVDAQRREIGDLKQCASNMRSANLEIKKLRDEKSYLEQKLEKFEARALHSDKVRDELMSAMSKWRQSSID